MTVWRCVVMTYNAIIANRGAQGRIKVCGGPRLDTFTGPYPSFYLLSSPTRTEG